VEEAMDQVDMKTLAKNVFEKVYDLVTDFTDEVPHISLDEEAGIATSLVPTPSGLVVIQGNNKVDRYGYPVEVLLTPELLEKLETVVLKNKRVWTPLTKNPVDVERLPPVDLGTYVLE
jgi:hypothetical protein